MPVGRRSVTMIPALAYFTPSWIRGRSARAARVNEAVCRSARKVLEVGEKAGDDPTVDMLTQRLHTHEKYAWMLRSLLE